MSGALIFIVAVCIVLALAFALSASIVRHRTEMEARRLAESMARETIKAAEKKAADKAAAEIDDIKEATHAELTRIARDLAKRD